MGTADAGEGGGAEVCTAGVLGCFEVCSFCDLQGPGCRSAGSNGGISSKRQATERQLQVWSAVLMSVGPAMSHCVDELAPTAACLQKFAPSKYFFASGVWDLE